MAPSNTSTGETWTETATFSTGLSQRRGQSDRPSTCACGLPPVMRTSRTERNPGRRFWRCSSPQGRQCRYYYWIDPEVATSVKEYVSDLKLRINSPERTVEAGVRTKRLLVLCAMLSWVITIGCVGAIL